MIHLEHYWPLLLAVPAWLAWRRSSRVVGPAAWNRFGLLAMLAIIAAGPAADVTTGGTKVATDGASPVLIPDHTERPNKADATRNGDAVEVVPPGAKPETGNPLDAKRPLLDLDDRNGTGARPLFEPPARLSRSLVPHFAALALALLLVDVAERRHRLLESALGRWPARWRPAASPTTTAAAGGTGDVFERAKQRSRRRWRRPD